MICQTNKEQLLKYAAEAYAELKNILSFWQHYAVDEVNGGFVGRVDHNNVPHHDAEKGSVMYARILWAYSAAYNLTADEKYVALASRAFHYINDHFIDKEFGGVYWTVDHIGNPLDTKKQVYANAFVVYALAEYYKSTNHAMVKQQAIALYKLLVEKGYDKKQTGYFEAFTREWNEIGDQRLSAKDANEKKSMNTHLHVIEAYANLYSIWPDEDLKQQIVTLLHNFSQHIINNDDHHLLLFFDEQWQRRSNGISYGHDIEAAWLLLESAEIIKDEQLIAQFKDYAVKIADAALEGIDSADGGMWYELNPNEDGLVREKHWWVQAEAMVGYLNAWQISGEWNYGIISLRLWEFVKKHIIAKDSGEWVWGVYADYDVMAHEDKIGIWKCPYHNSRTCIEIYKRLVNMLEPTLNN